MAKTKAAGTTKLGRDSRSKRLGVKIFSGQEVKPGIIIIRQRGTKFVAGKNTKKGSDDTIYAVSEGAVKFTTKRKKNFNGSQRKVKIVSVE